MTELAVSAVDNRGTDDIPFGYILFNDHSRIGYASGEPAGRLIPGDWGGNTDDHIDLAYAALRDKYPSRRWE